MHPPIGLLFSREKFDKAVNCSPSSDRDFICMDEDLQQTLFEWTMGHAGAIRDLLNKLCESQHYMIVKRFPNSHTSVVQKILRGKNTHC